MSPTLRLILAPLASLKLTVTLLVLAMILIFVGTTVQSERGIWDVQKVFFHSWVVLVDLRLFFPLWDWGFNNIPGKMLFPGGYTLIVVLLINVISAHSLRFKFTWLDLLIIPELAFLLLLVWPTLQFGYGVVLLVTIVAMAPLMVHVARLHQKRSGVILIHMGLILLLVGEVITTESAVEQQMTIDVGSSTNWAADSREVELAITDRSSQEHDKEIIIPVRRLMQRGTIEQPDLPFSVKIETFYTNSDIAGPMQQVPNARALATAGVGKEFKLIPIPPSSGTDSRVDGPSAFVTLNAGGQSLGTYLVSTLPLAPQFPQIDKPQVIDVNGTEYWMQLRFRRYYKPYTVHLLKFSHDRYTGTDTPRNFSSQVRVVDPANKVDREWLIWMNHPLRYAGETFYQSSFKPGDQTSILQVVHNPGWLMPYVSCTMIGLGMLIHFGMHLLGFLEWRKAAALQAGEPTARPAEPRGGKDGSRTRRAGGGVAVLDRPTATAQVALARPRRASVIPAALITALCAFYLLSVAMKPAEVEPYNLDDFSRLPVLDGGRVMPLDSLARNSLRIISGRSELRSGQGKRPAIQWLLDVFAHPDVAMSQKVFRIDHPQVLSVLALEEGPKFYSMGELSGGLDKLQEQYSLAASVDSKQRDVYQRKVLELGQHIILYNSLAAMDSLYLSPPLEGGEWKTFDKARKVVQEENQRDAGGEAFMSMIQSAHNNLPDGFNTVAAAYVNAVAVKLPEMSGKLGIEVLFNRTEPFIQCMALYVIAFVLAAISWLKWQGPLGRAAFWVLVLALGLHTLGLAARIYLQGRPPVTNLYSSAIFIAWAAVVFAVGMELIYRNGIATAAASAVAFPSLMIAHYLAGDGDTMRMLQAVLDTNIWLATHVVVITLGYTATFLAGFLAIGYVLGNLFSTLRTDANKTLYRMVYGVICFAMLFSFVGTILGGIWADQSWGRFWGWDPKENGAVLIVLWNAIVLHARWGGIVRERGFMSLAIVGNIITAWSWFGTNMLGVGLHSYGFMDSALFWLLAFVVSQLVIIAVGASGLRLSRITNEPAAALA